MENIDGIIKVEYLSREALELAFTLACRHLHKVINATSEQVSLIAIKQEMIDKAVHQMRENQRSPHEQKPEAKLDECLEAPGIVVNAEKVYLTIQKKDLNAWRDETSQLLQDAGFEDASKYLDAAWEL